MQETISRIEGFVRTYERNCDNDDVTPLLAQFADPFLYAGAEGTRVLPVAAFAAAIPKRREMFAGKGLRSTKLLSLEATPLDARYTLAKTRWQMNFGDRELLLDSSLLIEDASDGLKIVVYMAHQDVNAKLHSVSS